ncbi:MAG TPA: hypothetical protein VFS77_00180 [Pyrinomonadaceae bacterium]|nr:hypothetical protein [Pyrinomonadaceae bacterium]
MIIDNATFGPLLPNENRPGLRVERSSAMVDFGYSPDVMANNLSILGIDAKELNAAVTSVTPRNVFSPENAKGLVYD